MIHAAREGHTYVRTHIVCMYICILCVCIYAYNNCMITKGIFASYRSHTFGLDTDLNIIRFTEFPSLGSWWRWIHSRSCEQVLVKVAHSPGN